MKTVSKKSMVFFIALAFGVTNLFSMKKKGTDLNLDSVESQEFLKNYRENFLKEQQEERKKLEEEILMLKKELAEKNNSKKKGNKGNKGNIEEGEKRESNGIVAIKKKKNVIAHSENTKLLKKEEIFKTKRGLMQELVQSFCQGRKSVFEELLQRYLVGSKAYDLPNRYIYLSAARTLLYVPTRSPFTSTFFTIICISDFCWDEKVHSGMLKSALKSSKIAFGLGYFLKGEGVFLHNILTCASKLYRKKCFVKVVLDFFEKEGKKKELLETKNSEEETLEEVLRERRLL